MQELKNILNFVKIDFDNFTPKVVVGAIVNQEAWQPSETIQSSTSELEALFIVRSSHSAMSDTLTSGLGPILWQTCLSRKEKLFFLLLQRAILSRAIFGSFEERLFKKIFGVKFAITNFVLNFIWSYQMLTLFNIDHNRRSRKFQTDNWIAVE